MTLSKISDITYVPSNVITVLEDLLAKAKDGQIRAVVAIYEYNNSQVAYQCALGRNSFPAAILGEMEICKAAMIDGYSSFANGRLT